MLLRLKELYCRTVLAHPAKSLLILLALIAGISFNIGQFKLDASADSLVIDDDPDLRFYREINDRYSTDDFLIITYSPKRDMMSDVTLADISELKQELVAIDGITSVMSILDVPLLDSPRISLSELQKGIRTLQTEDTDRDLALKEFLSSPIYKNMILSDDEKTTALLLNFAHDEKGKQLTREVNSLLSIKADRGFNETEKAEFTLQHERLRIHNSAAIEANSLVVDKVRVVMDKHRDLASLHLGGVPMIAADMMSFIQSDITTFGIGVLLFLLIMLSIIFRRPRWVFMPLLCCFLAATAMTGILGYLDWRVTVISSNFISLMLIFTMSITIHLIVRYREFEHELKQATQTELVEKTIRAMFQPCFYTTLTTIAAFTSLIFSDIKPVIDFGYMMSIGLSLSFIISFLIFSTVISLLPKGKATAYVDGTTELTTKCAEISLRFRHWVFGISAVLIVIGAIGINMLTVENRFIDYFDESTEIYQGMVLIDQKLGGTTPLDIIINGEAEEEELYFADGEEDDFGDDFAAEVEYDDFEDDFADDESSSQQKPSYWFTAINLNRIEQAHDYLEGLPEIGKTLSIATTKKMAQQLNNDEALSDLELAILRGSVPAEIEDFLIKPYLSDEHHQTRISMRVMESDPNLRRGELMDKIHDHLVNELGFKSEDIRFTNMLVLYNNMLQSLFSSQIETLGAVFIGIIIMFAILFRSIHTAFVAIIPNLLSVFVVLGMIGLTGIPLDLMTITIASISVGIAVDDTIHYVHRFKTEFEDGNSYEQSMYNAHRNIGKAMYYTSMTIIVGFSILALSNFSPSIYFGLFTGLAMFIALIANIFLLPQLLLLFKPLGDENK